MDVDIFVEGWNLTKITVYVVRTKALDSFTLEKIMAAIFSKFFCLHIMNEISNFKLYDTSSKGGKRKANISSNHR